MPHDHSALFEEIQRFRADELPGRYDRLDLALPKDFSDPHPNFAEYARELQSYTDWAVERTCALVFRDFLDGLYRPDEFFLAFSIGSSLLNGKDRQICFADQVVKTDLRDVFCPFCAAGLEHECCDGGGSRNPDLLSKHAKKFLTDKLPDAWFGLIARILPQRVDFSVDAPRTNFAADGIGCSDLFSTLWKLKELISRGEAEDLCLLDENNGFLNQRSVSSYLRELLRSNTKSLGGGSLFDVIETYVSDVFSVFVEAPIFSLKEQKNRKALRESGFSFSRFLDVPMNWLLIGENFSMTVCYGGAHSDVARRCNGMLFLYTKSALKQHVRFALAEMAHLVLDNLVSLEDEYHASEQGHILGQQEGTERLKSALSYLTHDYGNSRSLLSHVENVKQSARIFETLLWLLKAARKYALKGEYDLDSSYVEWSTGGYQGNESVGHTLQLAYDRCSDSRVEIKVEGDALEGKALDVRFVGALTEIVRNIVKHTRKNGSGTITVKAGSSGGTVAIEAVSGPTYDDPCRGVKKVLELEDEYTSNRQWKGVLTIKRFCLDLAPDAIRAPAPEDWWRSFKTAEGIPMIRFESPPLFCGRAAMTGRIKT